MKVEVLPYSEAWPIEFEREQSALCERLGSSLVKIHHIGSTSVPGLAAKPIIDILLEVQSLEVIDGKAAVFVSLGYEVKGEYGIAGRRYFRKGGEKRSHHVHAYQQGSEHIFRHLAFRDYMRSHPVERRAYEALKLALAAESDILDRSYSARKGTFIEFHEAKAIQWQKSRFGNETS